MQGDGNPDTVTAWSKLAKSHLAAGRPNKGIPLYRRTLGYCLRELGARDPSTLRARNNLAMCYRARANGRTAGCQRCA
jgi:tetratricopeptide repeat protein